MKIPDSLPIHEMVLAAIKSKIVLNKYQTPLGTVTMIPISPLFTQPTAAGDTSMKVEQKLKLDADFDKKFRAAIDAIMTQENCIDQLDLIQPLLTETRRQIKQAFMLGMHAGARGDTI